MCNFLWVIFLAGSFFTLSYSSDNNQKKRNKNNQKKVSKQMKLDKKLFKKVKQKYVFESTLENLLKKNANPNAFCGHKKSVFQETLQRCISDNNESSIKRVNLFLNYGADCNIKDSDGEVPLIYLVRDFDVNKEALIKTLFKHKADPNIQDNCGSAPLHYIIGMYLGGLHTKLSLFLEGKANLTIKNQTGKTPLSLLFSGDISLDRTTTKLIIDHCEDKTFFNERFGEIVLEDKSLKLLKIACDEKINFSSLGSETFDRSFLTKVLNDDSLDNDIIKFLLKNGLNPCLKDENNNLPYETAHLSKKTEKRNLFAYAILDYVYTKNKLRLDSLTTFLICLKISDNEWKRFIPKPVLFIIRNQVFDFTLRDKLFKHIESIKVDSNWGKKDASALREDMEALIKRFG